MMAEPPDRMASPRSAHITAEELLEHASFLARLAREVVGDGERAADAVQEAYVVALERPPRSAAALRGWLATVVRNLARNARRGQDRRAQRERQAARPERLEASELALEKLEIQRLLFELVLALPEEKRTVLYLRYYEGEGPEAIAERLGVPVKTVKTRHTRALAELRERLDARSRGDRTAWVSALVPLFAPRTAPRGGPVAGGGAATILGGVLMKKLALALALVLAGWFLWQRTRSGAPDAAEPVARAQAPSNLPAPVAAPAPALETPAPAGTTALAARQPVGEERLSTTGALVVELSWSDGTPAAAVGIDAGCENDPAPREERFRTTTDTAGRARFEALFAGPVRLRLDRGVDFEGVEVEAGATRTVRLAIPEGDDVRGLVLDPEGQPVSGAELWGRNSEWRWPSTSVLARSAADGSFFLRDLGEYSRGFGACARGHQPSLYFQPADLPVGPDGARTVTIELGEPGGRIAGRVLDPAGESVRAALVLAGPLGGGIVDLPSGVRGEEPHPCTVVTGEDGSFALPGDFRPGTQPITAWARGYPAWSGDVAVALGATATLEIRLAPPARIEGRVLTADGLPAEGVEVVAAHEQGGGWYFHSFPPSSSESDGEGRFVLEWLAPGAVELNAGDRSRARLGKARSIVSCQSGTTLTLELRLDPSPTISGRVVDAEGRALAGWGVYAEPAQFGSVYPRQDRTDEEGRFLLANIGDCAHTLRVAGPDEVPIPPRMELENVRPGTNDVVLVVPRAELGRGRYHGSFLAADGRAPRDAELVIYPEGGNTGLFVEFDPVTGGFQDEALPGRYTLAALRGGSTLARSTPFEVVADGDVDTGAFAIGIPGRIEVEVLGLPPQALAELRFRLDLDGARISEELELVDGILRSHDLMPGTWTVALSELELFLRGQRVEVVSGESTRIQVEVERAYPLELGCSFARDGWSVLSLEARDGEGAVLTSWRLYPAWFRSGQPVRLDLPQGRTTIAASTDDGQRAELELEVGPGLIGAPPRALELR
jgi:RNA polymerase sigma-70 factor (ECF subfamily)